MSLDAPAAGMEWIREIHHVNTFVGAEEVQEIFFLRDQNRTHQREREHVGKIIA